MPRLPDLDSLGARPVPQSRRAIASNPRAGAVGDAVASFGERLAQTGQKAIEKEDRLAYATSRAKLLQTAIATRKELETDPDFETWEARFAERMRPAREEAARLIRSRSDRSLFEQEAEVDILRVSTELAQAAQVRRGSAAVADADEQLAALQDAAQDATDDASRGAIIGTAGELLKSLRSQGYITAEEEGRRLREWRQNHVVQRIETLRDAEQFEEAQRLFEASQGWLDSATETRVASLLTDALDNRDTLIRGEQYFQAGGARLVPDGQPATSVAPPPLPATPDITRMVAITARAESGNRERDSQGRLITSPAGAQGLMQVMPATARDPGHGIRPWDGKTDEDRSRVGRELLAALLSKYNGDAAKAWAAYNWGEARVDRAVSRHGDNWLAHAPAETRNYVRANVAALGGAQAGTAPQRPNITSIYAAIDADAASNRWSPEKVERIKADVARRVARADAELDRQQADSYEAALARAEALGDNYTDPSQLGDAYYRASELQQVTLRNMAETNRNAAARAAGVKANGDRALELADLQDNNPAVFARTNLYQYRHELTPGEFAKFLDDQRTLEIEGPTGQHATTRSAITSTINFYGPEIGITAADLNKPGDKRDRYMALKSTMEEDLRRLTGGRRAATEDEIKGAFDRATITVMQGGERIPRFEIERDGGNVTVPVPQAVSQRIINSWLRAGRGRPTRIQIAQEYMANLGREGFW